MEVGLGPGNISLDRDPAPPPRKWAEPPMPNVDKRLWIRISLGSEVDLRLGDIVLDGTQLPFP